MHLEIKSLIEKTINRDIVLEKPKDISLGHFATPVAFALAKEEKKNPMMIAEELAQKFQNFDIFESVTAVKGFLNFKLSNKYLLESINQSLKHDFDFAKGEVKH